MLISNLILIPSISIFNAIYYYKRLYLSTTCMGDCHFYLSKIVTHFKLDLEYDFRVQHVPIKQIFI